MPTKPREPTEPNQPNEPKKTPFQHMNPGTSELVEKLYRKMNEGDLDIDTLIEMYAKEFPKTAAIRLLQDLENCRSACENMYEEIKKTSRPSRGWGSTSAAGPDSEEGIATEIREKYEALGLLPPKTTPQTLLSELGGWALDKAAKCARATLQVLSRYLPDVLTGLHLGPGVTVMVQAGATWKATVTVGLESTLAAQGVGAAPGTP